MARREKSFAFVSVGVILYQMGTCVLGSTLITPFSGALGWIAAPVVTFAVRFIPSNQPHLALHLALLSLAEFPDCAELPVSLHLIVFLCSAGNTGLDAARE